MQNMAGKGKAIILVLVLHLVINLYKVEANPYEACRRVLLHSDFHTPCQSLSAAHKKPCMVSTPADKHYFMDTKSRYLYLGPDVTEPMVCAPRWHNTNTAECVSAPLVADNSMGWTWSEWSVTGVGTTSRRITLTGYDTDIQCFYVESISEPADCAAAKVAGLHTGVTTIYPDTITTMEVYCDQDTDGGGWIVIQRRISDSDFYLDWANYTAGFGDPATNYWLGLENIHLLTSLSYTELKVVVEYPAGTFAEADYSSFVVEDSSTDYTLQVSGYSNTSNPPAGDSLISVHHGQKFSTWDKDNDEYDVNCAQHYTGAWWYRNCHNSNLNGLFGESAYGQGMNWLTRSGYYQSVFSSKMIIRKTV